MSREKISKITLISLIVLVIVLLICAKFHLFERPGFYRDYNKAWSLMIEGRYNEAGGKVDDLWASDGRPDKMFKSLQIISVKHASIMRMGNTGRLIVRLME